MNIQDIMIRDIEDAERKERTEADRHNIGDDCAFPWLAVGVWLAVAILALGAAFAAGMYWQAERDLEAQWEYHAWLDKIEREAEALAHAMSNHEILMATKAEAVK